MVSSNKLLVGATGVLVIVLLATIYSSTQTSSLITSTSTIPTSTTSTTTVNQAQGGSTTIVTTISSQPGGAVTVAAHPVIAGNVSGGGNYAPGTQIIISQKPNHGYIFSNWTCTGVGCYSGTSSSQAFTVRTNTTETANYKVSVSVGTYQAGGGTVLGGGNYSYNSSIVTLQALPSPGYRFIKWICVGIGCYSGTNATVSFTAEFPVTQIADFVQLPPPFNYTSGAAYALPQGFNYARLYLNGNYTEYICGGSAAMKNFGAGIKSVSWDQLTSRPGYTSSGVSLNNTCIIYTQLNATDGALVGIGVDAGNYTLYNYSEAPRASFNLTENDSLMAVIVSGIYHQTIASSNVSNTAFSCGPGLPDACGRGLSFPAPTIDYPQQSNCTIAQIASNTNGNVHSSLAELFVCNPAVSGLYSVNASILYNGSVSTYVFRK